MKTLIAALAMLTATQALAHNGVHAHSHGQETSFLLLMGLGLVLAPAAIAAKRMLVK